MLLLRSCHKEKKSLSKSWLTKGNIANKKILLCWSKIYLVASVNAACHGWAVKKILRFRGSKMTYFGYKIAKIMN